MRKPTVYLNLTIKDDLASTELFSRMKRTWAYVAPFACSSAGETTILTMRVKLSGHPYWDCEDEAQNATWNGELAPWLTSKLRKVQNTINAYNNQKSRSFTEELAFEQLRLQMTPYTISFDLADSTFPDVMVLLEQLRAHLGAQGLLDVAKSIHVPLEGAARVTLADGTEHAMELARESAQADEKAADALEQ